MAITVEQVCDAIASTIREGSTLIKTVKSFDELTEGIVATDCPRIQIYPNTYNPDINNVLERTTFGAGLSQAELEIFVDIFARLRSHVDLDMRTNVQVLDELANIFEGEQDPPFFGLEGIKGFSWEWKRLTMLYGDARFMGGRVILKLRIF